MFGGGGWTETRKSERDAPLTFVFATHAAPRLQNHSDLPFCLIHHLEAVTCVHENHVETLILTGLYLKGADEGVDVPYSCDQMIDNGSGNFVSALFLATRRFSKTFCLDKTPKFSKNPGNKSSKPLKKL